VDENDGNDAGEITMEATMVFVAGFILGVTVAIVGGIKIAESSLYRQYPCTESAIFNGVAECVKYERRKQ
jgi:hypothetical protein